MAVHWPAPLLALVASALVALVLAAPADAGVPPGFVGITADDVFAGDDDYRTTNLSAMSAIGVQTIRQTFDWSTIERRRGVYDFSYHDAYVAKAAAHGIRILPALFNPPAFYRPTRGRAACAPRKMATFARFAKAVARRYGRRGTLWRQHRGLPKNPITAYQIWNEPNLRIYWCDRRPNARKYVAMLRTVGRAIKTVDRNAHIVTAGIPPSKLKSAAPIERYVAQMYRAGARRYFDSLAVNSYARNQRELRAAGRIDTGAYEPQRRPAGRLWITEIGWGDRGPKHRLIVGAATQARRITQAFERDPEGAAPAAAQRSRLLQLARCYRRYPPRTGTCGASTPDCLDINGAFKPAFYAFKNGVARLR